MSENVSPTPQENRERHKNLIIVFTVLTTVLAAALAALQADASTRADIANRDSQFLAVQASGELHRSGLEANYEFRIFGDYLKDRQEATILELTALEQESAGDDEAAQTTRQLSAAAQARADVGQKFSIFYNDPRYAPASADEIPRADQYIIDAQKKANELVVQQNQASDSYRRWNQKSDSYVTALTILAVAFFLFGLAQAVKEARLRLTFAIFGMVVIGLTLMVTAITLIG